MASEKKMPENWEQDMRDHAKAEREVEIGQWVRVIIGYLNHVGERVILHTYDLTRAMQERYRWVIRWRTARLQCQFPRYSVDTYYGYYDKRTGLKTDFNSCLYKLAAAKAKVTKAQRSIERYISGQRLKYPLFYDETTDQELIRYRIKLAGKIESCLKLEESIRKAVEQHRQKEEQFDE